MPPSCQLIASDQSWIEGEALRPVLTYKVRRPAHRQPGARKPRRGRP